MIKHSNGKSLGNTKRHAKIYRRYNEYKNIDPKIIEANKDKEMDNLLSLEGMDEHYKQIYNQHNEEALEFFEQHDPNRLFISQLYSPTLWEDMGRFFGIDVPEGFHIHANKSKK